MLSYPINDDSFISDELDFDSMENFEEAYKKALHKKYVSEVKVEDND